MDKVSHQEDPRLLSRRTLSVCAVPRGAPSSALRVALWTFVLGILSGLTFATSARADGLRVFIRAGAGNYLTPDGGGGGDIRMSTGWMNPDAAYRVVIDGEIATSLRHGARVNLQTRRGFFVVAEGGGGGAVNATRTRTTTWETFEVVRLAGDGAIVGEDTVAFRTANGSYLSLDALRGGLLGARPRSIGPNETFTLQQVPTKLVRLRAPSGHYFCAEGGGGREVNASRTWVGRWETFTLLDFSGSPLLESGDRIALETPTGHYFRAVGGGGTVVDAKATTASQSERFTLRRLSGSGPIVHGTQVTLQANSGHYMTAEGGGGREVTANRTWVGAWEPFTLQFAESSPIPFSQVTPASVSGQPFSTLPTEQRGTRRVAVFYLSYPEDDASPPAEQVRLALFGAAPSLQTWITRVSAGQLRLTNAGVIPVEMPESREYYAALRGSDSTGRDLWAQTLWRDILNSAEESGTNLRNLDGAAFTAFSFAPGGGGGAVRSVDVTSDGGYRLRGQVLGWAASDTSLPSFRAVTNHEMSHVVLGLPDRYGFRSPLRGDVIANRTWIGDWEVFTLHALNAGNQPIEGQIYPGSRVVLRAHNGRFLQPDTRSPRFVNTTSTSITLAAIFTLARYGGGALLSDRDRVTLRSADGFFVTAENGGGGVVTANRTSVGDWEHFELGREAGTGALRSGDVVTLRAPSGHYVVAETDTRTTNPDDIARGFVWAGWCGAGLGGAYDAMDDNCSEVMLSAYDRLNLGWVPPRVLLPGDRGCYTLRPAASAAEALVLWDPEAPREFYVLENRRRIAQFDEVPASGLMVWWAAEDPTYWAPFGATRSPALISAAARRVSPNQMLAAPTLDPLAKFGRKSPNAAFQNERFTLPHADGGASRFQLEIGQASDTGSISFCLAN